MQARKAVFRLLQTQCQVSAFLPLNELAKSWTSLNRENSDGLPCIQPPCICTNYFALGTTDAEFYCKN